jgi:hypothetical protein
MIVCENFLVVYLEGNLGELEKLYPTIPTIEVTIPHVHASLTPRSLKRTSCANKKFTVSD